jgi:hypothetical protein
MYFYGLIVAGILIGGTIAAATGLNRLREWWEQRGRARRAP